MKKILVSILLVLLLSGCSMPNITRLDNLDFEQTMYTILPLKVKIHNKVGNGYKYYAPKGVVRVESKKYNEVLKRNNNKYYLYVDVIDYYYKKDEKYKINKKLYYSDKILVNKKNGYLEIQEKKDKLYIQMMYNYAKIETYVDKKDLKETISDLSYILSSMQFNDSLLKKMYEAGTLGSKEEVYKLFDNKEKEGNFIEYVEEYDNYTEEDEKKVTNE